MSFHGHRQEPVVSLFSILCIEMANALSTLELRNPLSSVLFLALNFTFLRSRLSQIIDTEIIIHDLQYTGTAAIAAATSAAARAKC